MASQEPIDPRQIEQRQTLTIDFTNANANAADPDRSRYAWDVTSTELRVDGDQMVFVAGLVYPDDGTEIRLTYDFAADQWILQRPRKGGEEWFRWNVEGSVDILFGNLE